MTNRHLLLLLAALPALATAQPRPLLEIGSANFRPLPIAVASFRADPGAEAPAVELKEVLSNDLRLSGLFDMLDPKGFLADPSEGLTAPTIRFARWSDVGADGLVKAAVRRVGGELVCDFHLFEVRAGREVLGQTLRGGAEAARPLAHQLADAIVQYYTREPGVFRTRILAMRHTAAGGREIVASDVDGQRAEVVYRDSGLILLPSWRPDGKALVFTSYRGGRPELWTLDLATRRAQRLLAIGDLTTGGVYSPDGRRIAFTASVDGNSDVWVANADGSEPRRLTFQGSYNQTPRWSPRGDLIAFTARDERKVFDVFLISPETGRIQRVTQDQGRTNEEPTWAPNGRLLAFTSDRRGRPQLVVSNVSGERQTIVSPDGPALGTPAWGPFPR